MTKSSFSISLSKQGPSVNLVLVRKSLQVRLDFMLPNLHFLWRQIIINMVWKVFHEWTTRMKGEKGRLKIVIHLEVVRGQ
jgi:hypothetical protein